MPWCIDFASADLTKMKETKKKYNNIYNQLVEHTLYKNDAFRSKLTDVHQDSIQWSTMA